MPRRTYYFRDFDCPSGHKTWKMVEASVEWLMCETPDCPFAATRPHVLTGLSAAVHGDEIDYVDHNLGKDPIRIRSKSERRRLMKERGLQEFIRHTPVPGTDRSPYTTSWGTMDPYTMANAKALVERVYGPGAPPVPVEDEPVTPVANPFSFEAEPEAVRELVRVVEGTK